ncbi:TIGR02444 family protein [Pseudomonas lalucatii]|uniref:TIGR02444 family protein n=1 Tax=Pseudomonas lalucatii TaxID=1424203 RepID=A0ABS5Q1W1_9PSED|nr:TIGR02444 family protein [Pseudomonas lalucatii]MBS7662488.1 TIGR02444 family protein [Pseudomonas lalucatii]MBS7725884.1 TIGR02444 family protein [Pseudomonas lalucatii]QVM88523.1 TIGR02444 family protein [Pseudomonas lalucatii]
MSTDLWRFAKDYYQRPGVEAACLRLQEQGADVCLLICAVWLERRGVACSPQRAEQLQGLAQPWRRQVVEPLRQLRQDWRAAARGDDALAALREHIKRLELEAERLQLQRLAAACGAWPGTAPRVSAAWLQALAPAGAAADDEALALLRAAARLP